VLTAPDAVSVTGPVSVGGRAAVVTSTSLGNAAIVTNGVPAPPLGKVYQLWFMSASGAATPAGFLTPSASGQGAQVLTGTIGTATLVGVTVEPSGGSPAPTSTPVFALKI
jgi:anti-sigma-K factor RskA